MEAKAVKNASSFFNSAVIANSKMDSCVLMRIREKCFVAFNALLVCSFVLVVSDVKDPANFFQVYLQLSKVADHSFGSLLVCVICQIKARERLQLTS